MSFRKRDILLWLGLTAFWFMARFLFALPKTIIKLTLPPLQNYYEYLFEGLIFSSLSVLVINILRDVKDGAKEKRLFGMMFVWHRKYKWHWIGLTILFGIGRSFISLYQNLPPHFLLNFVKGGIFFAIAIILACLWEGNPGFFEGCYKREKRDEE